MDVKEKLVELLVEFVEVDVWDNGEFIEKDIDFGKIAENLIAKGVTVQGNTEISDELLEWLRKAPVIVMTEEPTVEVVQEWIAVKDRLPTIYDADANNCVLAIHKKTNKRYYHWRTVADNPFDFTYWMKTPQPPKGE